MAGRCYLKLKWCWKLKYDRTPATNSQKTSFFPMTIAPRTSAPAPAVVTKKNGKKPCPIKSIDDLRALDLECFAYFDYAVEPAYPAGTMHIRIRTAYKPMPHIKNQEVAIGDRFIVVRKHRRARWGRVVDISDVEGHKLYTFDYEAIFPNPLVKPCEDFWPREIYVGDENFSLWLPKN